MPFTADRNQRLTDRQGRAAISKANLYNRAGIFGSHYIANCVAVAIGQRYSCEIIGSAGVRGAIDGQFSPYFSDRIEMCHRSNSPFGMHGLPIRTPK
ncbi:hypothetical protein [Rhizobium gallicum]|uniref:hypothetical protein n=1 Tax=Rhizobium gallicum TaxID=56730 RepID=UPI001F2958BF|nr:hypothetical protein [Rhizobium gallicum]